MKNLTCLLATVRTLNPPLFQEQVWLHKLDLFFLLFLKQTSMENMVK